MTNSSASGGRPPLDRPTAWAYTLTNLLTLPGLGSLAGGRKVGYAQAALALAGFALTLWWLAKTVLEWFARGELPAELNLTLLWGLIGAALYGLAWLWSLGTSVQFHREAKANERRAQTAASRSAGT